MSTLTTITLFVSVSDAEEGDSASKRLHPNTKNLLYRMGPLGFNGCLRDVTDAAGGGNVPEPIFIGCFKSGDIGAFVDAFQKTPWIVPEKALLVVEAEHDPAVYKFYRPLDTP